MGSLNLNLKIEICILQKLHETLLAYFFSLFKSMTSLFYYNWYIIVVKSLCCPVYDIVNKWFQWWNVYFNLPNDIVDIIAFDSDKTWIKSLMVLIINVNLCSNFTMKLKMSESTSLSRQLHNRSEMPRSRKTRMWLNESIGII